MTAPSLLLSILGVFTLIHGVCTPRCNKLDEVTELFPVWPKKQPEDCSKTTDYYFTTLTSGRKLAEANDVLVSMWKTRDNEIRVKLQDRSLMQDLKVGQTCCFLHLVLRSYIEGVLTTYALSQHPGQNLSALGEELSIADFQLGKMGNCSGPVFEDPKKYP